MPAAAASVAGFAGRGGGARRFVEIVVKRSRESSETVPSSFESLRRRRAMQNARVDCNRVGMNIPSSGLAVLDPEGVDG